MTNEEIVHRIQTQINVAIALRLTAKLFERFYGAQPFTDYASRRMEHLNKMAGLFIEHALKLTATHREACEQWIESRKRTWQFHH